LAPRAVAELEGKIGMRVFSDLSNIPSSAMQQAVANVATKAREPFWFRWEIVLPLVVILTFLASIAGLVDRIKSAGK